MEKYELPIELITKVCKGDIVNIGKETQFIDFSLDSRNIKKGDMFLAIKGENIDGARYIEQAFINGANGCITQSQVSNELINKYKEKTIIKVENVIEAMQSLAKYKREQYNIPVIAVTGSVGKTSTKDIIASVLSQKYDVLKTEGNYNNHIGLPITLLKLKKQTAVVVEMGMNHFGEISLLTNIAKPTIAVITNIGTSHIGNLGSRENILKAKLEILEGLNKNGKIVINEDNDLLQKWKREYNQNNIYTYSTKNIKINTYENSSKIEIKQNNKLYIINVPIAGEHFVYNSLCAITVGKILNLEMEKIVKGIKDFKLTEKRMDIKKTNTGVTILEDFYNSSYESTKVALQVLKNMTKNRKIAVLGDMLELGEFSKELHEKVGEEVYKNHIDVLIVVGKLALNISRKAKEKGTKNIYECENNVEAIKILKNILKENDTVLIKASNAMNFSEIAKEIRSV